MQSVWIIYFLAIFAVSSAEFLSEPHLKTYDGNLYIYGADRKNVSFMISPNGYLNLNGESIDKIIKNAKRASASILNLKYTTLSKLEEDLKMVTFSIEQMAQRLNVCESVLGNLQESSSGVGIPLQFQLKINKLERRVKTILRNLAKRPCQKDPCMNGGTCHDKYLDYECRCLEGWEGKSCEKDVNECAKFSGSDLGCQNGATCINKPGTYECICAAGWYGLHCTRRSNDCSSGSPAELCGHGTCVTQTSGSKGYTCICDQGWKTDGTNAACVVDVDECITYPCSKSPSVTCHNTPGSFFCGPCPPGYSGNGFSCADINECLTDNGGCSHQPFVQCINTVGSFTCGPCPPGYIGDGKTCNFVGKCSVDNGGCHQNARCREVGSNVQCQCLAGFSGSGIGPFGCEPISGPIKENPCIPNPCRHGGRCYNVLENNFTCSCRPGYTGRTCNKLSRSPCHSNPCLNGGSCISRQEYFFCRCSPMFTGRYCQLEKQNCGGFLNADEGELQFPSANSSSTRYDHNLNCAWIIIVNSTLVINVTFEYFDLESAPDCQFDWVQIHDGRSAGDHIIGKFCGNTLPNNGTIVSTANYMYMWFKSDGSKSKLGFKLKWSAVRPVCGGQVNASIHGTIRSPGSPGKYPPNRDCLWMVTAPLGQRITFTFFEVYLEIHENCSYDFLEFHEELTLDSPVLARYCNTTIPPPLITPGNTALVYFHSDQYQSGRGFQIAYHPTPGYPGCGGIFTSRKGEISPPLEEGQYIKNMDCAWLIRLPENLRIKVKFTSFKLEDGNNCNTDFVEIREGSSISAPLIGRYCGYTLPPVTVSKGNVLFVRFYSDNSIQSYGFHLAYSSVCSEIFTGESGVIKSPGYPNNYRSQEVCTFIVKQPPGKVIELVFLDFDFEAVFLCFYDYVEIRDGHNEESRLIKRYCGNDRPPKIVSTHNYLYIKMVTDKDIEQRGFYANYTTIDVSCGGIFTAPEGEISSPSLDGSYPPNQICRWVIVGQPGEVIQLTFVTFKLEFHAKCELDYVAVYDNASLPQGGQLMGKFCGEMIPPLLISTENEITIVFRSDSSLSREGFSATYKALNMSTFCGGNYFTKTGVIKSPNYPKPYPNARTCVWVVQVPYGNKVTLNILDFYLEGKSGIIGAQCSFDYLEIRDGGYDTSSLIGRYCGGTIPSRIVSQSNTMYLKFKSDTTLSSRGFYLMWDGSLTGCGGTLSSVSGSITSPNYPESYGANSLCIYKISVARGNKILLNIMDLDLEDSGVCLLDYIEVLDGLSNSKSLGRFCSNTNHPASLTSSGNEMTIKFVSDIRVSGKGFYLKYRTDCKTNVTGHRGVIESPNFPEKFPPASSCTWIIKAPLGNKINISFSDFNFINPCNEDYLEIMEGNPLPTNTIGKFCKDNKPTFIASSLDWVHIKFVSHQYSLQGNFRMEWVVNGCGGTFIKPQGSFASPNYPKIYPPHTLCEYYITVDPSLSINLYIRDINLESFKDCSGDVLEIYGGPDNNAPLLSKICQKNSEPIQIQESGNQMYLKFSADYIVGGTGFFANYTTVPARCGGHQISNHGKITSRNYPKNYNAMDNCLWVIQVETNHRVNLTFEDFDLVFQPFCKGTFVAVFDGPTEDYPLLLKHCGNSIPRPNSLQSTSNYLTIRMQADQGFPAKGFKASYDMACGATITANEPGVISPSHYLQTKPTFENCTWTIISPEPDGHVTLTVTTSDSSKFTSEYSCALNMLSVYDGLDSNATLLGVFCGQKSHLPVVSRGNALFLELYRSVHIDTSQSFWAAYSSTTSACGGNLFGQTGSFASPNYPGSYPPNSECVWTLTVAPGNKIQINFKTFDLTLTEHCNEEYVEIREKDAVGKLLGVYCGQVTSQNLTSLNTIWIKFRSSKVGSGNQGFLIDYSLVHGNELTGTSGEIANPFYPKPFISYLDAINWRITVDFGSLIEIVFKELRLDDFYNVQCSSSVLVYDGYDETAPELVKACGLTKPDPVTSSSNVVFIVFSHALIHHGSLFLLEWKKTENTRDWEYTVPSSSPLCSRHIDLVTMKNLSVTLTNPGWPESYINDTNLNCEWTIESPDYQHLSLKINMLSITQSSSCEDSYISVQTKTHDTDWTELNKLCLSNETNRYITAKNFMRIVFHSGYGERSLFSMTVSRECGNSIKKPNGVIKFSWVNYTKFWTHEDSFCNWDITVTPGKKIRVVFTEFDFTTSDNTCREKYVMLKNGGSDDSPVLGTGVYCKFPGVIPLTTSNRLYIKVKTGYEAMSVTLRFEEVSPDCGSRIKLDDTFNVTIISSPNYPNIPPSKIECIWTFTTSSYHRMQIDFLDRFDLTNSQNCDEEYVEIRDGGTEISEELGRFCTEKPSTLKSSGNMLFVKYYTNATNPKNGFKAQISLAQCGGIIRSSAGVLMSPDYPNSYQYNIECRWEVETDINHKLKVSFIDLDLPLQSERLPNSNDENSNSRREKNLSFTSRLWAADFKNNTNCSSSASIVLEEPAPPKPVMSYTSFLDSLRALKKFKNGIMLGYICDNEPVPPIRSSTNKMIIVFQSGQMQRSIINRSPRGFKLNFTSNEKGCIFRMDTPSGVILSPGYPNEAPNYYFCTWKISVPKGRRITLKVNDFDLPNSGLQQRVLLYNEHRYRSRLAVLTGSTPVESIYKTSSNLMLVSFWSNHLTGFGHRGFKFTYDSEEPQICGGSLTGNEGFFSSPENLTSFYCKWDFQGRKSENQTIAFYVKDAVIGNRTGICSLKYGAVLAFTSRSPSTYYHVELCGNVSSQIVRSPFPYTFVTAIESAWFSAVRFNVSYKVFPCGGTVQGPETIITSPSYPNEYLPGMDCAWLISFPPSQSIKLTFLDFNLHPSCSDFLIIKNGPSPKSPLIGEYCGTSLPKESIVTSEGSSLFLEFHSDLNSKGKGFKISIEPANYVCGGVVHSLGYEFMTPNFPSEYDNNQECEWEIKSTQGTHIGLVFVDRFHIESSSNCEKDFVKVFDYVKDEWKLLKTLCGRELPPAINSTSNRMKILFRSNDAIVSDGFKAKWYQNCGRTLWNVDSGTVVSPGYPGTYIGRLNCVYIIDHEGDNIFLNFSQFNLEKPFKGICQYDSLTIYETKWTTDELVGKFCGSDIPTPRNLKGKVTLEFKTDAYNNYEGFVLNFNVSKCGGHVNESSDIGYFTEPYEMNSFSYSNRECVWNIEAPKNKIIALRIERVMLSFNERCDYPYLEIAEERKNETVVLSRLCGRLNPKQVVIKSTGNKMTVKLLKTYQKNEGFSASVVFTYGTAAGCGGEVTIDNNPETIQSPDMNGNGFYDEFLDCSWVIRAKPFHHIVADFRSIDVTSCRKFNTSLNSSLDNCDCDFVQLLDGDLYHSDVLLQTCGRTIPPSVSSSGSVMTLKFRTDGAYNGRGFNIRFSSKLSPCGVELLSPTETIQSLTSPNYPENYPEGLRCKWTIFNSNSTHKRTLHVHVVEWDIVESKDCGDDFLSLEDTGLYHSVYQNDNYDFTRNKTEGGVEIIRGKAMSSYFYEVQSLVGKAKLCGKGKSFDFHSATEEITIGFTSNSGSTKKGFKLDFSLAGCTRNYTGDHGHIKNMNFKNNSHCYITITAPSPNHTITMYFSYFTFGRKHSDGCSQSYMEVRDGPDVSSPLLGKFCGYFLLSPISSNGQNLWLHFYYSSPSDSEYYNIDITYTTTDKGKGCGGRFSGLIGTFTSPGYPQNTRKASVCRWDIQALPGVEIVLQFSVFDIGPPNTCSSDFIEFYDVNADTNTEVLRSRFCGRDIPAEIRSDADAVMVKYTTSVHNGGTGWQINFKGVPTGFKTT